MPPAESPATTIETCPNGWRRAALRLALAGTGASAAELEERERQIDRLLAGASESGLEGLFVARRDGHLAGAAWAQPQPGNAALVWPAGIAAREPESTALALMTRIEQFLSERGIRVAQALLDSERGPEVERLAMAGLNYATDLVYLMAGRQQFPRQAPATGLRFESLSSANRRQLWEMVERTYRGSLDCPQINDVRTVDDVMAGYETVGHYAPSRWLLVRHEHDADDVGCLILADHPQDDQYEIVYMGVAPEQRGRGAGQKICQWALWLTATAGRARLVVAADAMNRPAVEMYGAAGFTACERRSVFLRLQGGK